MTYWMNPEGRKSRNCDVFLFYFSTVIFPCPLCVQSYRRGREVAQPLWDYLVLDNNYWRGNCPAYGILIGRIK